MFFDPEECPECNREILEEEVEIEVEGEDEWECER